MRLRVTRAFGNERLARAAFIEVSLVCPSIFSFLAAVDLSSPLSLSLSLSHCVQACEAALRRLSSEGGDVAARRALAEQVKALREQQRR